MRSRKSIIRILCGIISLNLFVVVPSTVKAQSFQLIAVSDSPGRDLKIVLSWPDVQDVTGFNLYRKNQGDPSYPQAPINAKPIQRVTDCLEIGAILGTGSAEWSLIQNALKDSTETPFDPCKLGDLTPATDQRRYNMLMLLARGNYKIAMVMGLAYEDNTVTNGLKYAYKIEGINNSGQFVAILDSNIIVKAGVFVLPPAPTGVTAEAGDSKAQICWKDVSKVSGYKIYRSNTATGSYIQINPSSYTTKITNKLNGDTLVPNSNGFIDFQRYDMTDGMPSWHIVNGDTVFGPSNDVTYYYKISSTDLLGRSGLYSSVVSATPKDNTPPQIPTGLMVTPDENSSSFRLQWQRVKLDIYGHIEIPGVTSYSLYRYENAAKPDSGAVLVSNGILPDPNSDVLTVRATDASQDLRVKYVDKTWYYRVVAKDVANNFSGFSAAVGGIMKDTTRPELVKNITTEGGDVSIFLSWEPNIEPDIQGYMIYRGYCNFGSWAECIQDKKQISHTMMPKDCNDGFVFLGQVDQKIVKNAYSRKTWAYEDRTVPPGSPLCYAYWIKAVDKSGNISGSYPKPISPQEKTTIKCQRLRDKTPPEPALISGLNARDNAILIEWMGPPTQDIHSYYVYRAFKDDPASYKFIAQITVEFPPNTPNVIFEKYRPAVLPGCDSISYAINEYMTDGSFLDTQADPKQIYWYKVTGVDQNGNEGDILEAVGVSTFTFTSKLGPAPILSSIDVNASPCGLLLKWDPTFNNLQHKGFAVFKSTSVNGQYYQVAPLITGNQYIDTQVVKGTEYWYRIALLDAKGMVSQLSAPKSGKINP